MNRTAHARVARAVWFPNTTLAQNFDGMNQTHSKQFYAAQDFKQMLAEKNAGDEVEVTYYRLDSDSCKWEYKKGKSPNGTAPQIMQTIHPGTL